MLRVFAILLWCTFANAKEPELPLCPANIQFLPQNLPMHCRMPIKIEQRNQPYPLPPGFQFIQGVQSLPGIQMPAGLPGPLTQPVITALQPPSPPQPPPLPQPMPQMPGIPGLAAPIMPQKLPVVVMPYYSPVSSKKASERKRSRNYKARRNMYVSDETSDVDSNGSHSEEEDRLYNARRHRREKRRKLKMKKQMLTPLLQYVTKDGYVIYEKRISNGEAKKWLNDDDGKDDIKEKDSRERLKEIKNYRLNEINKQKMLHARKLSQHTEKN